MSFETVCEECGDPFDAKTLFAHYCGARCRMRAYRKTEKGKAMVKRVNERYKQPGVDKVCELCGEPFVTGIKSQTFCSECSGGNKANYITQKRYRKKSPEKHRARDVVNKRIMRGVSMFKETCIFCGKAAEAHHEDYSKPLDVTWVCKKHHGVLGSFSWNKETLLFFSTCNAITFMLYSSL